MLLRLRVSLSHPHDRDRQRAIDPMRFRCTGGRATTESEARLLLRDLRLDPAIDLDPRRRVSLRKRA